MAIYPLGNSISYPNIAESYAQSRARDTQTAQQTSASHTTDSRTPSNKGEKADENPRVGELSENDKRRVEELKARDREVRAHEAAHKNVGGNLAGAAHFSYEKGPDNRRYAVGGEVSIDTSKVQGDADATLQKANRIRAAALAPAEPSNQDRSVANQASQMANEARIEIAEQRRQEREQATEESREQEQTNADDQQQSERVQQSQAGENTQRQEPNNNSGNNANTENANPGNANELSSQNPSRQSGSAYQPNTSNSQSVDYYV